MASASNFIQIKNYRLDFPHIGKGAVGIVYRGRDNDTGETIAAKNVQYKEYNETLNEDNEDLFQRNNKEGEILKKLNGHKNIVKLLNFFDADSCHWFIMEFCELGDLPKYMKTQAVNLHDKIKIMVDVSSGLSFMHSMRPPVIHRDIKPENVLMKLEIGELRAKISDFGLGKLFEADTRHFTMMSGVGTGGYMAPEFFIDTGYLQYHPGVDTFALGLLFSVVLLFNKQRQSDMTPMSVENRKSGMYIHYGLEMKNAYKNKAQMPQLFEHNSEAEPCVKQLQEIITQMTQFNDRDRPNLLEVKTQIMELHYEIVQGNFNTTHGELKQLRADYSQLLTDFHSVQGEFGKLQTEHKHLQAEKRELQHRNRDERNQQEPDIKQKVGKDVKLAILPSSVQQQQSEKLATAVVLFPYEADNIDKLSIKEGDVVDILQEETEDKGWWKVRFAAKEGLVPDNYIKKSIIQQKPVIKPKPIRLLSRPSLSPKMQPEKLGKAVMMSSYGGENFAKLSVKEGEMGISQQETKDKGWWKTNQQLSDIQQSSQTESFSKLLWGIHSMDHYIMVAAIHLDTTSSCYALSFRTQERDIHMNRNWGESMVSTPCRTPTCVMLDSANRFVAFGYDAEKRYAQYLEENNSDVKKYQMYRNFPKLLHNDKTLSRSTKITSETGNETLALGVFSMAIKYLKDHLLHLVSNMVNSVVDASLACWVLTVPVTCGESGKQFMREAAFKAGCNTCKNQLILAPEHEAAAAFCKNIDINGYLSYRGLNDLNFEPKTKYLVIDAADVTVDISAYEVIDDESDRVLHVATGGLWRSIEVDNKFILLLNELLGEKLVSSFKHDNPWCFLRLMTSFKQAKKWMSVEEKNSRMCIVLPWTLGRIISQHFGMDAPSYINSRNIPGVKFSNDSLVIDHERSLSLFTEIIAKMMDHVAQLLRHPELQGLSYVMLVGEFGSSKVLQNSLKQTLPSGVEMLVPAEPQLAKLQGAVYYGYNQIQNYKKH